MKRVGTLRLRGLTREAGVLARHFNTEKSDEVDALRLVQAKRKRALVAGGRGWQLLSISTVQRRLGQLMDSEPWR